MRKDLLALGETELVALANRGLYKRAVKELSKGNFELEVQQETVILTTEQITTKLCPDERLIDSECSCSASGFCRHKILAVLAYQQSQTASEASEDWCPSCFEDSILEKTAGKTIWKRVQRALKKEQGIELQRGPKPKAALPTCHVSFLVPQDLNYARCDCAERGFCEHIVLAALAFRESGTKVVLGERQAKESFDFAEPQRLIATLLEQGLASSAKDLAEPLAVSERRLREQNLLWLADLQSDLAESLSHYQNRSAQFHSPAHALLLLEWWVRTKASECASPSVLLGLGQSPETQLEQTSFTCLGMQVEQFPDCTKAKVFLVDAKTSVVTVLKKRWTDSVPSHQLKNRVVAKNVRLDRLCSGRLVTEGAVRKANRELRLRTSRLGRHAVFEDAGDWLERFRPPLLVTNFHDLSQELKTSGPELFRPRVEAENLRILKIADCHSVSYSPGSQELVAILADQDGNEAALRYAHQKSQPQALNALAESLTRGVQALSGFVSLESNQLQVTPLSIVNAEGVTCLATAGPVPLPPDLPLQALDPHRSQPDRAWEMCCEAAHRGLKFLTENWKQDCREFSQECHDAGFVNLASQLENLATKSDPQSWWQAAVRAYLLR